MCGIAGIVSQDIQNVSRRRLRQMTTAIQHRGPDGEAFWINEEGTAGFGHRRLAIIDLSEAGAQPMHYWGRFTITYNGEIYNYVEIKEQLIIKGYHFSSSCDTEVLIAAYACYGKDCLQHFNGMFSFAIWDNHEKTLFCARDRFGEKPFYYHYSRVKKEFVFASEMKALWAAGISKKANNEMILNYLTLGWVQNQVNKQTTFFETIFSLPPSHYLLCKIDKNDQPEIELQRYWDLDKETTINDFPIDFSKQHFLELLTSSIKCRLRSEVTIGSSVSGGVDSSSIVAIVNLLSLKLSGQKTFSAVFPGFEKDESKYIRELVNHFSIDNYTVTPTINDFIRDFEKLAFYQEEPFQSASIYAQYKVYELAKRKGTTVILDGQGADETMAGYPKYYHWYWQEKIAGWQWKDAKNEMKAARQNGQRIDWGWKNYVAAFMPQLAAKRLQANAYKKQSKHSDITKDFFIGNTNKSNFYKPAVTNLNDILYFNTMQSGLEELLRYADRNSMAHSVEVRLPFLSHELVQFIFSLPSSYKINKGFTKYLLRSVMNDLLPQNIVWRKDKTGFEPPQKQWMQNKAVEEYIQESRRKLVKKGILKPQVLEKKTYPKSAHEADNYDWRYLCAAQCI